MRRLQEEKERGFSIGFGKNINDINLKLAGKRIADLVEAGFFGLNNDNNFQ